MKPFLETLFAYPERRFPPRAGMAPAILTGPVAAMGATGNVTDPGMSEAISGTQPRREVLSVRGTNKKLVQWSQK